MNSSVHKIILVLSFYFLCQLGCFAQSEPTWSKVSKKNAISINIAGTTPIMGVTFERLMSDRFNFEIGIGLYSLGIGVKYFPFRIYDNKMVLHTSFGSNIFQTPLDTFGSGDFSSTTYLEIGLTYFGREGLNFSLGIGPSFNYDFTFNETAQSIYGNLKVGYRF